MRPITEQAAECEPGKEIVGGLLVNKKTLP